MTPRGRERLERLATLLESLPEDGSAGENGLKFNLKYWAECGTMACACGHAAMDPWFKKRGFQLYKEYDGLTVKYNCWYGFTAASMFFDLQDAGARHLFSPDRYRRITRPRDVAARIREFLS